MAAGVGTWGWVAALASCLAVASPTIGQCIPDWTQIDPGGTGTTRPVGRLYHGMAYDSARDRIVMYGGATGSGATLRADQWEWNGTAWTQIAATAAAGSRRGMGMTFDSARQKCVVFGGATAAGFASDTWEYDAAGWTQRTPTGGVPSIRAFMPLAYDSAHAKSVLFGGWATGLTYLSDTWLWDGAAWTQASPSTNPSARGFHSMASDSARGRVVLFGGLLNDAAGSHYLGDTWEWDGTNWAQITPIGPSPPARAYHTMTYDPALHAVVLFGGFEITHGRFADTWAWDGASWTQLGAAHQPTARQSQAVVYDVNRHRLVLFGGLDTAARNDVWSLATPGLCAADVNCTGGLSVQDIFDFLGAWFASSPTADFNGVNGITVQDIFDFLGAWFAGC
jgi:hypothetical protein